MKDDTISRQAVLKLLSTIPPEEAMTKAMLIQSVKQMDAVQPEIIRCRDCRYKYGSDCDNFAGVWVKDDDFCSRAERREVNE